MSLSPLLSASPAIQIHVAAAVLAMPVGAFALLRRSRDPLHKMAGRLFAVLMAVTILSSFFIWSIRMIGPFSPIHVLSVLSTVTLVSSVVHIRRRQIAKHAAAMRALYWQALGIAGLFTLLPGRLMHRVIFGQDNWLAAGLVIAGGLAALAWFIGRPALLSRFSSSLRKTDPL